MRCIENTELAARSIVERALNIAAEICIYTNRNLVVEELELVQWCTAPHTA